jgi:hypothetical protein
LVTEAEAARLSDLQRRIVALWADLGGNAKAVAVALGCPWSMVYWHMARVEAVIGRDLYKRKSGRTRSAVKRRENCGRCGAILLAAFEHKCPLYVPEFVGHATDYMRSGGEAGAFAPVSDRRSWR